jgi:hypothetical protein
MPAKKTTAKTIKKTAPKKAAKATVQKKTTKSAPKKPGKTGVKKKTPAKAQKVLSYECRVCGFRLVVDEYCGCVEEHVILCCNKPMKTKRAY